MLLSPAALSGSLFGGAVIAGVIVIAVALFERTGLQMRGYRRLSRTEVRRVAPLVKNAADAMDLAALPRFAMADNLVPNAWTHMRTIVLTTGLLQALDDGELLGPAAYDAAFTSLLLGEPPIAVPRLARPLVRGAGRLLARRFLGRYRANSGVVLDRGSLRWHQSVVCLPALVEVAGWASAGELDDKAGHPWLVCGEAFASRMSKLTGARVRPR